MSPPASRRRRTVGAGRSPRHLPVPESFQRWWSLEPATARRLLRQGRRAAGRVAAGRMPLLEGGSLGRGLVHEARLVESDRRIHISAGLFGQSVTALGAASRPNGRTGRHRCQCEKRPGAPGPSALQPPGRGIEKVTAHPEAAVEHVAEQFLARQDPCEGDRMPRHDRESSLGSVCGRSERVDRGHLERELDSPDTRKIDREPEQIGARGQWREPPGEGEREVVLVGWRNLLGRSNTASSKASRIRGSTSSARWRSSGPPHPSSG